MIYKFKSKVSADLIMLEPHGRRLLELIGKDESAWRQGILLPADMPAAIAALNRAILEEEAQLQADHAHPDASAEDAGAARERPLRLRQRAFPFIDMLRRCLAADEPVVWGV